MSADGPDQREEVESGVSRAVCYQFSQELQVEVQSELLYRIVDTETRNRVWSCEEVE